jgi:hypothetical protein
LNRQESSKSICPPGFLAGWSEPTDGFGSKVALRPYDINPLKQKSYGYSGGLFPTISVAFTEAHEREQSDTYCRADLPKPHLTQKLQAYLAWCTKYFSGIRKPVGDSTCGPTEVLALNGGRLAILPINTALFCQDDNDHGKLWVGRRCLDKGLSTKHVNGRIERCTEHLAMPRQQSLPSLTLTVLREIWTTDPSVFPRDNFHERSFSIRRQKPGRHEVSTHDRPLNSGGIGSPLSST